MANTTDSQETVVLLERQDEDGSVEIEAWKEKDMIEKWLNVGLVKGVSSGSLDAIRSLALTTS